MSAIVKNPIAVTNRLAELGVTREQLLEVVGAMVGAKADCTDNDPPGAPGWSSWRIGTRRMRELLLIEGWERDETNQISSIVNKQRGVRIVVSNTDDGTCSNVNDRFPQNRSKKGAGTDRLIQENQGSFMGTLDETLKVVPLRRDRRAPGPVITWYLCVYSEGDDARAELSCPIDVDGGFFTGFVEQIYITGFDEDGGTPVRRRTDGDDDGAEFNIPVTRKR